MDRSIFSELDGNRIDGLVFCSRVYEIFEGIRSSDGGRERLRMRTTDVEKKLLEELLPICRFVQVKYKEGRYIDVEWFSGSQTYDAKLYQRGDCVHDSETFVEVTCAVHQKDYLLREHINLYGGAFGVEGVHRLKGGGVHSTVVIGSQTFVLEFSEIILKRISHKALKPYPDLTSLVIVCMLDTLYTPDEWAHLIEYVKENIPANRFYEIFIFDSVSDQSVFLRGS